MSFQVSQKISCRNTDRSPSRCIIDATFHKNMRVCIFAHLATSTSNAESQASLYLLLGLELFSLKIPPILFERMTPMKMFMRRLLNIHKLRINTSRYITQLMYTTLNVNLNFNLRKMVDDGPMVLSFPNSDWL